MIEVAFIAGVLIGAVGLYILVRQLGYRVRKETYLKAIEVSPSPNYAVCQYKDCERRWQLFRVADVTPIKASNIEWHVIGLLCKDHFETTLQGG